MLQFVDRLDDPAPRPSAVRIALIRQLVGPLRCHVHNLVASPCSGKTVGPTFRHRGRTHHAGSGTLTSENFDAWCDRSGRRCSDRWSSLRFQFRLRDSQARRDANCRFQHECPHYACLQRLFQLRRGSCDDWWQPPPSPIARRMRGGNWRPDDGPEPCQRPRHNRIPLAQ